MVDEFVSPKHDKTQKSVNIRWDTEMVPHQSLSDEESKLGISQNRNHAVIHNVLHMPKVSARCVPKLLGPVLKRTRQGEILSYLIDR